jgi:ATP-dependent Lhr-like helicase
VIVTPAPGRSARLPFWRGEGSGRPAELGELIGDFMHALADEAFLASPNALALPGLSHDENALANIKGSLRSNAAPRGSFRAADIWCSSAVAMKWATGASSCIRRMAAGYEPWALAIAGRLHALWGADASIVASDDGIVARLPDTEEKRRTPTYSFRTRKIRPTCPGCGGQLCVICRPFSRVRRARIAYAWAHAWPSLPALATAPACGSVAGDRTRLCGFPILLETVRECLQDVYDLPALDRLMRRLNTGEVQISGVTTTTPSPFAASLLFGYVAEFMYESDAPLAERRASVLSLDSELLGNLLGQADPGELLDPLVIRQIDDELQRLAPDRKARGKEGLFDLLRELGPMTPDDLAARHRESRDAVNLWLEELLAERRAFRVTIGESQRIACMDDAARLRDALGVRLPADLPDIWLNPVATPLADLFLRYVQTHTLFTVQQIAHAFGLGVAVAQEALEKLRDQGKVMRLRAGKPAQPGATRSPQTGWVKRFSVACVSARCRRPAKRHAGPGDGLYPPAAGAPGVACRV